jgi:hypothetical protein
VEDLPRLTEAAMNDARRATGPLLLEVTPEHWDTMVGRVEPWLTSSHTLQSAYCRLAEDVARRATEPHIREYLGEVAAAARRHESVFAPLRAAFGVSPQPAGTTPVVAAAVSTAREIAAQAVGRLSGARGGGWRGLRELLRSNLDSVSGFAVSEQLGLALGMPHVVELVFPVVQEKQTHQLLLQELFLEMASNAVLYRRDA